MHHNTSDAFKHRYASDSDAAVYRDERFARSRRWRRIDRREQEIVADFLARLRRGACALDLPCGAGRLAPLFGRAGVRYVGADVALPMLQAARRELGDAATLVAADALDLPFAAEAFDAVVSVRLLHRIREPEGRAAMLREMRRVAAGPVLATYYLRTTLRGLRKRLAGKYAGVTAADIREDARQAGLRVAEIIPLGRWLEQQCFVRLER